MFENLIQQHAQALLSSIGRLWRAPLSTLFTVAAVGTIVAIPLGLYTILLNLQSIAGSWDAEIEITLYLETSTANAESQTVAAEIQKLPEVHAVEFIPADTALEQFATATGLQSVLAHLDNNPLSPAIVVQLQNSQTSMEKIESLTAKFGDYPHVSFVQTDVQWLQRLGAIYDLLRTILVAVSTLLIAAVALLIYNSTRLHVVNRIQEIEVLDQVGGTASFIRRPFIYSAIVLGLLSVFFAWGVNSVIVYVISEPADRLAMLYNYHFEILHPALEFIVSLIAFTVILSWLASRLTVDFHVRQFRV